jgi:tau tubulin kinase
MELLGKNVANFKRNKHDFNYKCAVDILIQMLNSIEVLHDRGYIHRDIKPTNFVIGRGNSKDKSENIVYMVDFGLAKLHLDKNFKSLPPRTNTDFRGTLTYASLNAHNKKDLSRRDDLWSFFFVILDLLNESLPWRRCKDDKVFYMFNIG